MAKENDVLQLVGDYLTIKRHFFFRANNIPVFDSKRNIYRAMPKYSKHGVPDFILIWNGQFVGLECKQKGKYQSKEQKEFEKECKEVGAEYYVIRSLEDLKEIGL
jgi:hypothetical protein